MTRNVLILGENCEMLELALETMVPEVTTQHARWAADSEGIDIDAVVVQAENAMEEINDVRTHPRLFNKPIVLIASEGVMSEHGVMSKDHLRVIDVHQVDEPSADGFARLTDQVRGLLDRQHYPSNLRFSRFAELAGVGRRP